jgi:hypothetical protein
LGVIADSSLQCEDHFEKFPNAVSYIELHQELVTVETDSIVFNGEESVSVSVPREYFLYDVGGEEHYQSCVGWLGGKFDPELSSTQMLPDAPKLQVHDQWRAIK